MSGGANDSNSGGESATHGDHERAEIPAATSIGDQSLEYQECEIIEEIFTPDIQQMEQVRLEAIYRTRSLLRDAAPPQSDIVDEADGNMNINTQDGLFSPRDPLNGVHHQLAAMLHNPLPNPSLATQQPPARQPLATENGGPDYINQEVIDKNIHENNAPAEPLSADNDGGEHKLKRLPSSNGYKSQGNPSVRGQRSHPVAVPEASNLGEFEKRLLMAKHKSKAILPNMYKISWYHPGISRHIAESLLVARDIKDGTYLLRDCVSEVDTVTLSVRCQDSVKHYRVVWDGKQFIFGLGKFSSLKEFKEHFSHQPVISGDSGVLVKLCYPYPRGVSEPAIYIEPTIVTTNYDEETSGGGGGADGDGGGSKKKPSVRAHKLANSLDLSINSKEGYLTKLGFHRKNWKKRWFVLYRNELKYFNSSSDKEPLKVINLEDVYCVDRDDSTCKSNCMRLVTSYRTFFMYATSEVEINEWVQILDWRLKQQSKQEMMKK